MFFAAGKWLSFYFHFLTITFLFLTLVNVFYQYIQKEHVILKNFGILGQGRYLLESIGPELRQYLYANDEEERPFSRNERSEVYRKAKDLDSARSFGSMREFDTSEMKIRHSMFPISKEELLPFSVAYGEERGLETTYTIRRPIGISGMSYGALGQNAVRALARGAKLAGIPMNTGEGGYPKYHLMEGCDLIFQMGTAKFGVRHPDGSLDKARLKAIAAKPEIKMIEIKLSQGAKPGKGGLLPKEKITDEIAELRNVQKDKDVISPAFHVECTSVAKTVEFIREVQNISGLPTGIKLCPGNLIELESMFVEMKQQNIFPDFITVDGAEGGTGAAPKAFIDAVGMPLAAGLHSVNYLLNKHAVRDRLKLNASGKLVSPSRQIMAFALGADAIFSARGFMLSLGCIQSVQCGQNTCPIGIATHDPELQRGLVIEARAPRIANYVKNIEHDLKELLCATGCRSFSELSEVNLYLPPNTLIRDPQLDMSVA